MISCFQILFYTINYQKHLESVPEGDFLILEYMRRKIDYTVVFVNEFAKKKALQPNIAFLS